MSADLGARKLLVAAYLYYNHAHSIMSDAEYDKGSQWVADKWGELPPLRQWCLGDPGSLRAGGCQFKYTKACVGAARELHEFYVPDNTWKFNEEHQVHYLTTTG